VDIKLLEDLAALHQRGSFVAAAKDRHVTHPAFGRRIRALEAWAGTALVQRGPGPATLTAAGKALLEDAKPLLATLLRTRDAWAGRSGSPVRPVRIGTGRTLARTIVADWLARMSRSRGPLKQQPVQLITGAMAEGAARLEQGQIDLLCCYEHPAFSLKLSAQRFRHISLAQDRLVPVQHTSRAAAHPGWITYADNLSLAQILRDHVQRQALQLPAPRIVCDSADALLELALKGLGLAWLPWSLVGSACRQGVLVRAQGLGEDLPFEVRLYRPRGKQTAGIEALWAATEASV
jgi:LysR family transcriptional regulator, hypochlorite-specific transcription factor HypT